MAGLALDFCVQYTAIDSAKLGYTTYVLKDTLPVDLETMEKTIENLKIILVLEK